MTPAELEARKKLATQQRAMILASLAREKHVKQRDYAAEDREYRRMAR